MKLKFEINHPIEIFAAKAEAGELGDNLPPGAPIEYIDLTETHPKYLLEECDQWPDFLNQVKSTEGNVRFDHYEKSLAALRKAGVMIPSYWKG